MQKRATCVGRRSKCLRFQPSKSSSSSPLEAYYRTFTERGKNLKRMNLFHSSRAAASRRSFLFFGPSSSFFRCWSVHPYQKKQSTTTQKAENDISNQQKERIKGRPKSFSPRSCFGESLKSACLIYLNKSSSFMREKRGKKAPSFFLNFFQSIKFFSFLQKNVRVLHYARDI